LYLATQYKNETPEDKFSQAKFQKKSESAETSSCIMAICVQLPSKADNPLIEEICSVATAVQNMHLVATAHGVGAYWSTGGIYGTFDKDVYHVASNPSCLKEFLKLENQLCIGWFYIGSYFGNVGDAKQTKTWPTGRRKPMDDGVRAVWR
jgi:nitroreductase